VAAQRADPGSTLSLYRTALHLRRSVLVSAEEPMVWIDPADDVLAFDRGTALRCVVNLSGEPLDVTGHGEVLLASGPCDGRLPPDTAAWFRVDGG
jgi:alpha-glucosidase